MERILIIDGDGIKGLIFLKTAEMLICISDL